MAHDHSTEDLSERVLDPVCGMKVDPRTSKRRFTYKGTDYFSVRSLQGTVRSRAKIYRAKARPRSVTR